MANPVNVPAHDSSKSASFLRTAWYCAAWAHEITRTPLGRTILGEQIVMFRTQEGAPVALESVCPHRLAPLHEGMMHGDAIACRYHGLQFDKDGKCVNDPHGGRARGHLRVRSFPAMERNGIVWLWFGDPEHVRLDMVPAFSFHSDPGFRTIYDRVHVQGSYQLVSDNLLDLSHTQHLHTILKRSGVSKQAIAYLEDETTVEVRTSTSNTGKSAFMSMIWTDGPEFIDNRGSMRWEAPCNLLQTIDPSSVGGPPGHVQIKAAHLATPETPTSCHYFWSLGRNVHLDDATLDGKLRKVLGDVFANEDAWMISLVQRNMEHETDILRLPRKPRMLPSDRGAVRARLILRQLIEREDGGHDALALESDR
jgi:phenylpropionate dioxygenase-like ring-hydroxylating dioxygenase large terminal subunit